MKVIGITGGVGAGKSEILSYIQSNYNCKIFLSDNASHQLMEKGKPCYEALINALGRDVLDQNEQIDKKKMASKIFGSELLRNQINEILHPAVKQVVLDDIAKEKEAGNLDYFFLEAALLIECGYLPIVDEMWYIYASEEVRRKRLKDARGYSDEKIDSIIKSQLSEEIFRENCHFVIDNSGTLEDTKKQIDGKLGEH